MLRAGLTGGIACGKSRVLRRLELGGCRTLDLDGVAHQVLAAGRPAHAAVRAAFGPGVLDARGEIDRNALGAIVFRDSAARARLNAIVHPEVRREERRLVAALAGGDPGAVVVVDAALLVEAGMHLRFDRMVVVHCSAEQQLQRLMARDALSRGDALARIGAQMPVDEKRRFAHVELDSSGSLEETDARADALAAGLVGLARQPVDRRAAPPHALAALVSECAQGEADASAALRLLGEIVEAEGLEMFRVAALAGRPDAASWLAPPGDAARLAPDALMPPVAAYALARRGRDDDWLRVAALSVARAVTADSSLVSRACATARHAARELSQAAPSELASAPAAPPAVLSFTRALGLWAAGGVT